MEIITRYHRDQSCSRCFPLKSLLLEILDTFGTGTHSNIRLKPIQKFLMIFRKVTTYYCTTRNLKHYILSINYPPIFRYA